MKTPYILITALFILLTACNPGGSSTKYDEGPLELYLNVSHEGTVSESGFSYYWVSGTTVGQQYTVTLSDIWSSVNFTLDFCTSTCATTICYKGKGGSCSSSIISDGQDLLIDISSGNSQLLTLDNKSISSGDSFKPQTKASVIGAKYTIIVQ